MCEFCCVVLLFIVSSFCVMCWWLCVFGCFGCLLRVNFGMCCIGWCGWVCVMMLRVKVSSLYVGIFICWVCVIVLCGLIWLCCCWLLMFWMCCLLMVVCIRLVSVDWCCVCCWVVVEVVVEF